MKNSNIRPSRSLFRRIKTCAPIVLAALVLPACYVDTDGPIDEHTQDVVDVNNPNIVLKRERTVLKRTPTLKREAQNEVAGDVLIVDAIAPSGKPKAIAVAEAGSPEKLNADVPNGEFCALEETTCGDLCCTDDEVCELSIHPLDHRKIHHCVCYGPNCDEGIDPTEPLIPSPWPGLGEEEEEAVR